MTEKLYRQVGAQRVQVSSDVEAQAIREEWARNDAAQRREQTRARLVARVEADLRRAAWARLAGDPALDAEELAQLDRVLEDREG